MPWLPFAGIAGDDDAVAPPRGFIAMSAVRHGVCSSLECWEGSILKDLMVATKDWQSSTERDAPLRHHLAAQCGTIAQSIPETSTGGQPTSTQCQEAQPTALGEQLPFCELACRSKEICEPRLLTMEETMKPKESIQQCIGDPRITLRFQPQEAGWRSEEVSAVLWLVSEQGECHLQKIPFHSSYPDVSEARGPSKVSTGQQLQKANHNR